jgi:hypothetical protein
VLKGSASIAKLMNTVRPRSGPLITIQSRIMNTKIVRYKLIKRIIRYCEVHTMDSISSLSIIELQEIERSCFIKLKVKAIFRARHIK